MSRRQTLGVLSPNVRTNTAARVLNGKDGGQGPAGGASVPAKARKSVAPGAENRPSAGMGVGMGVDRRSSAFGPKPSGPKQDPRPLGDKNFLNSCVHTLITYLSVHGYPAAVSPKTLASPTAKDFTLIVQFLFQRFDSNMKTFGKIEDEVPMFFKRLNYPFQISKSALFAVGSPHSWPAVLAALTWLVELLNYNEKVDESSGLASASLDTEEGGSKKQFFEFISKSYRHFLAGDDARCELEEEEMVSGYKLREEAIVAQQARTREANAAILAELERQRSEPAPLAAAQQRLSEHLVDSEKFVKLIENLQALKLSLQRKLSERQADLASKQEQIAAVAQENEALRAQVAAQPVNKADLNRMILERTKQKEVLEAVTSQCEDMEGKVHQQEAQIASELRTLEAGTTRYNQLVHRLKLAPASAKRAEGVSYELRINRDAATSSDFSNLDLKGTIRPALERLCDRYRIKTTELSQDLLSLEEQAGSSRDVIAERKEENAMLDEQIRRMEGQLQSAKEAQEDRVKGEASRADILKQEVFRLRNLASAMQADLEARKKAAAAELEAMQRSCDVELSRVKADLSSSLDMMVQHRLWVRQRLERVVTAAKEMHSEILQSH